MIRSVTCFWSFAFFTFVVDSDNNVSPVLHDLVCHLAGQVEDGVLVGLDGLGGVDDEDQGGVERTV